MRLGIIVLWSPVDPHDIYTDIYDSFMDAAFDDRHNERPTRMGFGVFDWDTGRMPNGVQDWHDTVEEAEDELLDWLAKKGVLPDVD